MDTLLPFALLCFTSFFTLTNPLGTMPVFLTMTKGMDDEERRHIVKRATIISFITLLAFYFLRAIFIQIFWNIDQWLSYCCRFYYFEDWI